MKNAKHLLFSLTFVLICQLHYAQNAGINKGHLSGNLEMNANFYQRDSLINASNTPQYDHQLFGADAWLQLNYNNYGFDIGLRFDMFNNSALLNPQGSYTAQGIGRWYIKKKINKLGISVGYLYDQLGSGIIFRSYEVRTLAIDNALYGARLTYDLNDNWQLKGFTGKQKQQFENYGSIIKGFGVEGFASFGEEKPWSLAPGAGVVNRTIDDATMNTIVNTIATYNVIDSIPAKYNVFAFTAYNTLTVGNFSWYIEGAYKTAEQYFDPLAVKLPKDTTTGVTSLGRMAFDPGNVFYTSLSWATKGFGITVEGKRTDHFTLRTNPFVTRNQGMVNFLPPMARVNTYRLTARYQPAVQEIGEQAIQVDIRYKPFKKLSFNANFSNITDLDNKLLYRELYTEILYKYKRKWTLTTGVQFQNYNQALFEVKPNVPNIETITPYLEFLYKFTRKKSIRFEAQYMNVGSYDLLGKSTEQDYGDWVFGLVEVALAPHWTFTVSDMYNLKPGKNSAYDPDDPKQEKQLSIHYPRFDIFYTYKSNRFSLSYVKQVEGIVCSGGVCRLEPAFSGVKFTASSTF